MCLVGKSNMKIFRKERVLLHTRRSKTKKVRKLVVTRGRDNESSALDPRACTLALKFRSRYHPGHPIVPFDARQTRTREERVVEGRVRERRTSAWITLLGISLSRERECVEGGGCGSEDEGAATRTRKRKGIA